MNLIIDLGNTSAKLAIYQKNSINKLFHFKILQKKHLVDILFKFPKIKNVIISSVINVDFEILNFLKQNISTIIELTYKTSLPIKIKYNTKKTLGNDRIAGVIGANNIFPNTYVLVVDAGTAITYDIVTNKNIYIGGNISPGLNMRYKALNYFTEKLPLVTKNDFFDFIGNDTNSAIVSGVQNGIIYEISQYINNFKSLYNSDKIILTGGDCFFFDKKLKKPIFAEPNLLINGLNKILEFNV